MQGNKTGIHILLLCIFWMMLPLSSFAADFSIGNAVLQSKKRVSRTEYLYTFKSDATNHGTDAWDVTATLTSTSDDTVVVDGDLSFGDIPAGDTAQSTDTFSIKQNRLVAFDETALTWTFQSAAPTLWDLTPSAGQTDADTGWGLTVVSDIPDGAAYYYVKNDVAAAVISTQTAENNGSGTFQVGFVADMVNRSANMETLDWTQFQIVETMHDGWNYPAYELVLDDISVDGDSIVAAGYWANNADLQTTVTYRMLEDAPIMKISVLIENSGNSDFSGYLMYQLDPDGSGNQNAYAPGLGWAAGFNTSGWTENYIYDGPKAASDLPAHGIAWVVDNPTGINVPGYICGAWFDASVAAGGTTQVSFYHITDLPPTSGDAYTGIADWATMIPGLDPDIEDMASITGTVTDEKNHDAIAGATIVAKNTLGEVVATVSTNDAGDFRLLLPMDVYTMTVTALGYDFASRSISMNDTQPPFIMDFALTPVIVWAGSGKTLSGNLAEGSQTDIVMENSLLAMTVAVDFVDPQLTGSTAGKPVDMAVAGLDDGIDWINLPTISQERPQGTEAWQVTTVQNDLVEVIEVTDAQAVVRSSGTYSEVAGIAVETIYTIKPDEPWILAETRITNDSGASQTLWVGDVIDNDEGGQTSYVPGIGQVTAAYANPAEYNPSEPWIAQYGNSDQCYGLIYLGDAADFTAYGNTSWIMSQKEVSIDAGATYSMKRYLVAVSTTGFLEKADAVATLYNTMVGVTINLELDQATLEMDETVMATLSVTNVGTESLSDCTATVTIGGGLATDDDLSVALPAIMPGSTETVSWQLAGVSGGTSKISVEVAKANLFSTVKTAQVFVSGPGWYAGDNHSHSIWSDGTGTIAENYASARNKGLSFVTSTDHNSISQGTDVYANSTNDFLGLLGEEITSGDWGHALAYNIDGLIGWRSTPQQAIDDAIDSKGGKGLVYIAHPYYPGLEWDDWSVSGYTGIEVWNGFYAPTHSVNARAFAKWDALNSLGYRLFGISNSDAHNVSKIGDPHIRAYLEAFTREEIITALATGRFYGTNGPALSFTVNDTVMGSDVSVAAGGETVEIAIGAAHANTITTVQLIKNGTQLTSWSPASTTFSTTFEDNAVADDFYRIVVQTSDDGYAFSNPIWIVE